MKSKTYLQLIKGATMILISGHCFSQANTSLSNLVSPTAVNVQLLPSIDNSINLGSASNSWKDAYLDGSIYVGGARFLTNSTGTGTGNTALGSATLNSNTSGSSNTANGYNALYTNTSGGSNVAIGFKALYSNTTGYSNTATGSYSLYFNTTGYYNTASGQYALYANTSGSYNTASGRSALCYNTSGNYNAAQGSYALYSNTTGYSNIAIGYSALYYNTTGSKNTASGSNALFLNTTGSKNTANGYLTLYSNTTGSYNSATGSHALYSNTIGTYNIANGYEALYFNTSGTANIANGSYALYNNTIGDHNVANGHNALSGNTTGDYNTANGSSALQYNKTGYSNTANGYHALNFNNTGFYNTANGYHALSSNYHGHNNTACGSFALHSNWGGDFGANYNTASGTYALYSNDGGDYNTACGAYSLYDNTFGNYNAANGYNALYANHGESNTASGYSAGSYNDFNDNCSFFGFDADQIIPTELNNSTAIGNSSRITASNQVRIGNTFITSIGGYDSWTDLSDKRFKREIQENVPGLEFINKLKPVTYHLDVTSLRKFIGEDAGDANEDHKRKKVKSDELAQQSIKQKEKVVYTGFIAQDVEEAANELGYDFSGVDKPQNDHTPYGLRYSQFVVPLVKAVQELSVGAGSQETRINMLEEENRKWKAENSEQKKQIDKLNSEIENIKLLIAPKNLAAGSFEQKQASPVGRELEGALEEAFLGQNIPNPFDNSTLIPFRIHEDCKEASIVITESASGKIMTVIPVTCNQTYVLVEAGNLNSGSYHYSLYVNKSIIDTRQLIVAK